MENMKGCISHTGKHDHLSIQNVKQYQFIIFIKQTNCIRAFQTLSFFQKKKKRIFYFYSSQRIYWIR